MGARASEENETKLPATIDVYRDLEGRTRIPQLTAGGGPSVICVSHCSLQSQLHCEARSPWGPEIRKLAQLLATTLLWLTYLHSSFRAELTGPNAPLIVALRLQHPSVRLQKVSYRRLRGTETVQGGAGSLRVNHELEKM